MTATGKSLAPRVKRVGADQFLGQNDEGDPAVLSAAFRCRIVRDGMKLAVPHRAQSVWIDACILAQKPDGGGGACR